MKPIDAKIARRKQRQRERRARRQTDQQRTAFVAAVGPDEASVWCDGTAGWRRPRNGPHSDGESQ
jgi:hypothetical protein